MATSNNKSTMHTKGLSSPVTLPLEQAFLTMLTELNLPAESSGSTSRGTDATRAGNSFASQRGGDSLFETDEGESSLAKFDHTTTDEWDASKTPPSRFQQRKNSIYSTPASRDSHVDRHCDRDAAFHAKLVEKGWAEVGKIKDKVLGGRRKRGGNADATEITVEKE